jgi:exosome complex component RRP40
VVQRSFEAFLVDINGHTGNASLGSMEFQGATKTNKPNYAEGTLVMCRVRKVDKQSRVELTCIDPLDKKAWNSGEASYKDLQGGLVKDFPIAFCRELLSQASTPAQTLLTKLGQKFPYEINVGHNGRVWVRADSPAAVIFIFNALERLVECGSSNAENVDFIMQTLVGSQSSKK